ncbi:MAG: UDP-N-acetylmuramate dehydrogenase [Bacteroidales bacterium]|nr:UDP-N-acetylmuramate dehydrogenase [Bacteroidales bacterium]
MSVRIPNTLGLDAFTDNWFEYADEEQLAACLSKAPKPWLPVGAGSNLLFSKPAVEGSVFHCTDTSWEASRGNGYVRVRAGAGMCWDDFVKLCVDNGWYGAENLSLIPGDVGAAAVQNIGAYGAEAGDLISSVEVYDTVRGHSRVFFPDECEYAYRSSVFKKSGKRYFVLKVVFKLSLQPSFSLEYGNLAARIEGEPTLQKVRDAVIATRQSKLPDPQVTGSAGSFFMNPVVSKKDFAALQKRYPDMPHYPTATGRGVKLSAGWLIDRAGCKGMTAGDAAVYEKHALILVNRGKASAGDVIRLASDIIERVEAAFGVRLCPEVETV